MSIQSIITNVRARLNDKTADVWTRYVELLHESMDNQDVAPELADVTAELGITPETLEAHLKALTTHERLMSDAADQVVNEVKRDKLAAEVATLATEIAQLQERLVTMRGEQSSAAYRVRVATKARAQAEQIKQDYPRLFGGKELLGK